MNLHHKDRLLSAGSRRTSSLRSPRLICEHHINETVAIRYKNELFSVKVVEEILPWSPDFLIPVEDTEPSKAERSVGRKPRSLLHGRLEKSGSDSVGNVPDLSDPLVNNKCINEADGTNAFKFSAGSRGVEKGDANIDKRAPIAERGCEIEGNDMVQPVLGALNCRDQFCGTVDPQARMEDTEEFWGGGGGSGMDSDFVNAVGRSGGLLCIWNPGIFVASKIVKDRNFLLINEGYWEVLGDFSAVRVPEESMKGAKFTYCQKQGRKLSNIDRILVSLNYLDDWSDSCCVALRRSLSDHSPIILRTSFLDYGRRPFIFFNSWFDKEDFEGILKEAVTSFNGNGNPAKRLHDKLRHIKERIKSWVKKTGKEEEENIEIAKNELELLNDVLESRILEEEEEWSRMECFKVIYELEGSKAKDLHQRSRIKWASFGDDNSVYFHRMIKQRGVVNSIHGKMKNDVWIQKPALVKKEILNHFRSRFVEPIVVRPVISADGVWATIGRSSSMINLSFPEIKDRLLGGEIGEFSVKKLKDWLVAPRWFLDKRKSTAPPCFLVLGSRQSYIPVAFLSDLPMTLLSRCSRDQDDYQQSFVESNFVFVRFPIVKIRRQSSSDSDYSLKPLYFEVCFQIFCPQDLRF
ncbi:hypothetical protein E3N88_11565 [Mikania micrantha]|uniref:Uncharacterized protein n=1 Tax=Mikania micrantha TaxID=192012 RepID=A0A5N6PFT8_9ASTR|nr:hypothetical protein E3N88_11565 [Mikania micrantha]